MELAEGAAHRRGWDDINDNIRDRAVFYSWYHPMPGGTNYISPVHTKTRRKVLDSDHDGQADYLDKLVNFDTYKVATDTAREFSPIAPSHPVESLDGTVTHLAAMALNTATGYNTETKPYKKQNIIGGGYFEPGPDDKEIVRFEKDTAPDGAEFYRMTVNANYAHMSVEALRAVAHYRFVMEMDSSLGDVDRKLMGLVFAAFSINYDEAYYSRDPKIWEGLLQQMNLPADIPMRPILSLLDDEHHDYSGNRTHIREWKEDIPADALAALEEPSVGVPG
jgi:hypothetical protein